MAKNKTEQNTSGDIGFTVVVTDKHPDEKHEEESCVRLRIVLTNPIVKGADGAKNGSVFSEEKFYSRFYSSR